MWLDRLADEHDNIRAALRVSRDEGEPDLGLRMVGSTWRFFHRRGYLPEARSWLEELLAMEGSTPAAKAVGLEGLGGVLYWQADYAAAEEVYRKLLDLYRALGDALGVADTLFALSTTLAWLGHLGEGRRLAEEARAAYEVAQAPRGVANVSGAIAWSTWQAGELEEAIELWDHARALYAAVGDEGEVRETDVARAAVLSQLGRTDDAVALAGVTLEAMIGAEDIAGTIQTIDFLASIVAATHPDAALRLASAAASLRAEAGGGLSADSVGLESVRSLAAATMDEGAIAAAWNEGAELDLEASVALAKTLIEPEAYDAQ